MWFFAMYTVLKPMKRRSFTEAYVSATLTTLFLALLAAHRSPRPHGDVPPALVEQGASHPTPCRLPPPRPRSGVPNGARSEGRR